MPTVWWRQIATNERQTTIKCNNKMNATNVCSTSSNGHLKKPDPLFDRVSISFCGSSCTMEHSATHNSLSIKSSTRCNERTNWISSITFDLKFKRIHLWTHDASFYCSNRFFYHYSQLLWHFDIIEIGKWSAHRCYTLPSFCPFNLHCIFDKTRIDYNVEAVLFVAFAWVWDGSPTLLHPTAVQPSGFSSNLLKKKMLGSNK